MNKKALVIVVIVLFQVVLPLALFGVEEGTGQPWDDGLTRIYQILTGNTVRIIGFLLIIGAGLTIAFTEGQGVKKILFIIIGVGIALNAASFGALLFGVSEGVLVSQYGILAWIG